MRTLVLGLIVLLVAVDGSAHDFWLAANPPRPAAGARVTVTASVGEHYPKGTNYTPPERVDQWRVIGEAGEVPITREFRREGESLAADLTRAAGLKAEFVPATDPTAVQVGQSLTVQLLAETKPVANAEVTAAGSTEGPAVKGRTDADGRVTLKIDREGAWLIKTVHMAKSGASDADWESFWVTLVFHTAAQ